MVLRKKAEEKAKEVGIETIRIEFNYPKDEGDVNNFRLYNKPMGGCMLDLGIYVYKLA